MVTTVLYIPPVRSGDPMTFRMSLLCRMSRTTIMIVRRMLSERESEKYEIPNFRAWGVVSSGRDFT